MAAEKGEREARRQKRSESSVDNQIDNEYEEEPDFSDPEDFVDDIDDEGVYLTSIEKSSIWRTGFIKIRQLSV